MEHRSPSPLNILIIISFVPKGFPVFRQLSAPILTIKKATAIQNKTKKPWNGLFAESKFCLSKVENWRVNTMSLNFCSLPLCFLSFSCVLN